MSSFNPFDSIENKLTDLTHQVAVLAQLLVHKNQTVAEPLKDDQLFTVKQLAEYWQCHEQTIMQKKRKGELPFFQHGRKLFFRKSEVDALTANPIDKRFSRNLG
jgi:excisionase family DNA binding protein